MKKKTLDNFKKPFFFLEDYVPVVGYFLIKVLRDLRFVFYKAIFFLHRNRIKDDNIFKIYWVNPQIDKLEGGRFLYKLSLK